MSDRLTQAQDLLGLIVLATERRREGIDPAGVAAINAAAMIVRDLVTDAKLELLDPPPEATPRQRGKPKLVHPPTNSADKSGAGS